MHDYMVSLIRTNVPVAVGAGITWLGAELGVVIDEETGALAVAACVGVVIAIYYAVARAVEQQWPAVGRVLVGLGAAKAPVYPARVVPGRVEPPSRM
jgi:hypothetical protein